MTWEAISFANIFLIRKFAANKNHATYELFSNV